MSRSESKVCRLHFANSLVPPGGAQGKIGLNVPSLLQGGEDPIILGMFLVMRLPTSFIHPLNILLLGLVLQLEAREQTGGSFRLQM